MPDTIDIEVTAKAFETSLNFSSPSTPCAPTTDITETVSLLDLCRKFDCESLKKQILHRLEDLAKDEPWAVVEQASKTNVVEAGRTAIRRLGDHVIKDTWWDRVSRFGDE